MSIEIYERYLDRRDWTRVTKSRFAWAPLDTPELSGAAGLLHIQKVTAPLVVHALGRDWLLADEGYYWLMVAPEGANWWLTVQYDKCRRPLQYYFDVTRRNVIDGRDSRFEDLMLDVALIPNFGLFLLDRDELDAALAAGNVTPEEHAMACAQAQRLMDALPGREAELEAFCQRTFHELLAKMDAEEQRTEGPAMIYETACGAVVFTRQGSEVKYLIIHQTNGVYGFPKGHVEGDETEHETAVREICEETGLRPRFVDGFRAEDQYPLLKKPGVTKRVIFFLAEYEGQEVAIQEEELTGAELLPYDQALERLSYDSSRRVLRQADEFLKQLLGKD